MSNLTEEEFFNWLRDKTVNKRLSQPMVNGAKAMIASMGIPAVQNSLALINEWTVVEDDGKPTTMSLSPNGVKMIAQFEKFVSKPYLDMVGVWTIGYGNTYYPNRTRVKNTDKPLTEPQAAKLKMDIINLDFAPAVNIMLAKEINKGKISQNQFDALVSLAYNIGTNGLQGSSVIRHIKVGAMNKAADSFLLWNKGKVNGTRRVIKGLTNRREAERALFLTK